MNPIKRNIAKQPIIAALTLALSALFLIATAPQEAFAQSALVKSDMQRGAGNTARLSALTQQIGLRLAKLEKCNKAGLVYDKDDLMADGNGCTVGKAICGDNGRLYGLNHTDNNPDDCVKGLQIKQSGEVIINKPTNHPNGFKVGETNACNGSNVGLLRYESSVEQLQICYNGTWNEI